MSLNDSKIRNVKPSAKPYKVSDSHGLYLLVIDLLKGIEKKGLLEVASRTRQHMCNIMRHAVHQELIENNPAANLDGIITSPVKRHYPALQLERLPELLTRIEGYKQARELTRLAVSLTLHLFIRSSGTAFRPLV